MRQDQVVAVEISHRVMSKVPNTVPARSITDLSQSIRIEQDHFEPDRGTDQSSAFPNTRFRIEFLGKIHLSDGFEAGPDQPAYKTQDGHTLH